MNGMVSFLLEEDMKVCQMETPRQFTSICRALLRKKSVVQIKRFRENWLSEMALLKGELRMDKKVLQDEKKKRYLEGIFTSLQIARCL